MDFRPSLDKRPAEAASKLLMSLIIGALLVYLGALYIGPVIRGDDTVSSFANLNIWTGMLRAENPFSAWAPADSNGYGSPLPFFYHKLFNLTAATLVLLSGDIVTGYRLALIIFSAVMFWGAYRCATRLGFDRLSSIVTATACMLCPYAIDNIGERGAVAEYSAMALAPWLLGVALDFHTDANPKWRAPQLVALLTLLALAHVLIFAIVVALLSKFSAYQVVNGRKGCWALALSLAAATLAFTVLVYVPFAYWSGFFCSNQARAVRVPWANLTSFSDVLVPFPWSRFGYPGTALLIALYIRFRTGKVKALANDSAVGLGIIALLLLATITPLAKPLWQLSPKLDFVQFPWRALSVISPIAIVALFGLVQEIGSLNVRRRVQLALVIVAILNVGIALSLGQLRPNTPMIISSTELRALTPSSGRLFGEYFPAAFQARLNHIDATRAETPASTQLPAPRPLIETAGCVVPDMARPTYFDTLRITAVCPQAAHLRINQFSTPFLDSTAINNTTGAVIQPAPASQFIDFSLPAGQWTITVRQRTYLELTEMAWRNRLGR